MFKLETVSVQLIVSFRFYLNYLSPISLPRKGPLTPSFNVGGQFDPNSQNGIPIAPVVGTGLNIGDSQGGLSGSINSNVALQNGQANPQFGAGANIGAFNLGSLGGFFGGR